MGHRPPRRGRQRGGDGPAHGRLLRGGWRQLTANAAVARDLAEVAALLSLDRQERFRPRAFRAAARVVAALPVDVADLSSEERRRLDGVGPAVDRAIAEHLSEGTSGYLRRLRQEEPPGVGQLVQVMGVSAPIARALSRRGATDLPALATLVADGTIRQVEGVGERTAEVIADGLRRLDDLADGRPALRAARLEAERWARDLAELDGVHRVDVAGEVRRGVAQPDGLDLVVVLDPTADRSAVRAAVTSCDGCIRELPVVADGADDAVALLTRGGRRLVAHLATPATAGTALVVATGSPAHVEWLRDRGLPPDAPDEDAAHAAAGVATTPPPLREADAPPVPDRLVQLADLRGDGHVHSDFSGDGHDPVDRLAQAAVARGYDWLAITDHAELLTMNGLSRDDLRRRDAAITAAQERHPDIVLLRGLELNIQLDGGLDYDDDTLMDQDWCIASIHQTFQRSEAVQTDRMLAAVAHPAVDAIGHPVGRLLGRRPGYRIDLHAIAQAAAETGTALEVNGSPLRLDLDARLVAIAVAAGAPLVLDSDAHRVAELDYVVEAVRTAQRGGAPLSLVRNAGPPPRRSGGPVTSARARGGPAAGP